MILSLFLGRGRRNKIKTNRSLKKGVHSPCNVPMTLNKCDIGVKLCVLVEFCCSNSNYNDKRSTPWCYVTSRVVKIVFQLGGLVPTVTIY